MMPVFSGQGMVLIQAIQEMGIRFPQVHTSAEYLAGSAIKTAEMFGFDALIIDAFQRRCNRGRHDEEGVGCLFDGPATRGSQGAAAFQLGANLRSAR